MDNYLHIAKRVLATRARPLTAQQILTDAGKYGLLPAHLSGQAMQKTLQARIAEDIYSNRESSIFYRTKLGTYFLRELADDTTLPQRALREFGGRTRVGRTPKDRVLHVQAPEFTGSPVIVRERHVLDQENTEYRHVWDDWDRQLLYRVMTMTFVFWRSSVLTHRAGRYSPFRRGDDRLSAGLRRYVDEYDVDLFVDDPSGIDMSALREYARVVGGQVASETAELRFMATYIDPASRSVIYAVSVRIGGNSGYAGELRRRLDAPQLRWTPVALLGTVELDPISEALLPLASSA